jgi:predicted MFS family arabinose efflux permease
MSAPAGSIRAALGHARFRRLLGALAVSQAGDWLYNLALLALVYERTGSSTWVAVTTAARVAPIVVLGPLGGVVADRWDRRRVMVASDLIRAATMVGLALVAVAGLPVVLAPVLAALATAAAAPYPPCVAATTPRLVPDADLPGANAARAAVGTVCLVAGPGFGAVLLLLGSPGAAFAVNALTFLASAAAVLSLPAGELFAPGRAAGNASGVWTEVRAGAAALRARPDAVRLVGADVMCSAVYGAHTVLLLLLSRALGLGDAGYGYVLAAYGVGGVLGTALAGRVAAAVRQRRLLVGAAATVAVPAMLLALTPCLPGVLLWSALVGAGCVVVEVATETTLQRSLDPDVLGRAYGIALPASLLGIVVGALVAGPLVAALGLTAALLTVGAAMLAYALILARGGSSERDPAAAVAQDAAPVPVG